MKTIVNTKTFLNFIAISFALMNLRCNDENQYKKDFEEYKKNSISTEGLDSGKVHIYCRPSTDFKINIFANGILQYNDNPKCETVPGCLLCHDDQLRYNGKLDAQNIAYQQQGEDIAFAYIRINHSISGSFDLFSSIPCTFHAQISVKL